MRLSEHQIDELFKFTQKKFVHWYDLQVELVDHLASRIEDEMEADKKLSFDSALQKVYKGFGIFGFAKIVQEKSEQLQKASRKMWWKALLGYFKWPKIIQLLFLMAILWQLSNMVDIRILTIIFVVIYLSVSFVLFLKINKTRKAKKNLMVLQFGPTHISSTVFFYETFIIWSNDLLFSSLAFTILATIGILFKMVSFELFHKVREDAVRMYPEAFA